MDGHTLNAMYTYFARRKLQRPGVPQKTQSVHVTRPKVWYLKYQRTMSECMLVRSSAVGLLLFTLL